MRTRFIFANDPIIYRRNGVLLCEDETPSVMSLRTFFNGILDSLFVVKNSASRHICSDLCWQRVQVIISAKNKGDLIGNAVPRNRFSGVYITCMHSYNEIFTNKYLQKDAITTKSLTRSIIPLINDFEELLDAYSQSIPYDHFVHTKIEAIGITFFPCALELKVTEARIYLG